MNLPICIPGKLASLIVFHTLQKTGGTLLCMQPYILISAILFITVFVLIPGFVFLYQRVVRNRSSYTPARFDDSAQWIDRSAEIDSAAALDVEEEEEDNDEFTLLSLHERPSIDPLRDALTRVELPGWLEEDEEDEEGTSEEEGTPEVDILAEDIPEEVLAERVKLDRLESKKEKEIHHLDLAVQRDPQSKHAEMMLERIDEIKKTPKNASVPELAGGLYVVSNEGSLGAGIVKIGISRSKKTKWWLDRLNSMNSGVPFEYDIHLLVHTDDAPRLEKYLHGVLGDQDLRVNKANKRKEFFYIAPGEVKKLIEESGMYYHIEVWDEVVVNAEWEFSKRYLDESV